MEGAIIRKLTDKIYIVRAGKNTLETIDYIAYIGSPESSELIKVLNIREIQNNVKEGLTKLIEPLLDKKDIDLNNNFDKLTLFMFLLKVKLYIDYILKRSLNRIPLTEITLLRKKDPTVVYQIALYLKDNDINLVIPDQYQKVLLNQELFEKFFKIIEDVTFRSNQYLVKRAFVNFSAEINKFFQN
jgi:hypothetical protein